MTQGTPDLSSGTSTGISTSTGTGVIRIGTRRSALAMTQATWVADRLRELGHEVELVQITTFGDTSSRPLSTIGGTGVFATAIRHALHARDIDVAVHSLKDLPVEPEPGLVVAAIPVREDPRDALVARDGLTLGELPAAAVVGTGSPRRAAQLAALGLGLQVTSIRGNVGTRISRVHDGSCDAVVLARAGLVRLGLLDQISEVLDPLQMLSAPGQGALAVECRCDDAAMVAAVSALDDADTRSCVTAERALLAALEAGCTAPIGALAEITETAEGGLELWMRSFVGTQDGVHAIRRSIVGPVDRPERLGRDLAAHLLADGAGEIATLHLVGAQAERQPPYPAGASRPEDLLAAVDPVTSASPSRPDQPASERAQ